MPAIWGPDRPMAFEVREVAVIAVDGILDRVELDLASSEAASKDCFYAKLHLE